MDAPPRYCQVDLTKDERELIIRLLWFFVQFAQPRIEGTEEAIELLRRFEEGDYK